MLTLSPAVRIYLATGATDLRRSIDGLSALVRERAEHNRAEAALWGSQHQLALNYIQRGVALFEAGKMELGLAWLERGLRATPAGDPIREGARNLIAGWTWGSGLTLPHEGPVLTVAFSKDGRTAITGRIGRPRAS